MANTDAQKTEVERQDLLTVAQASRKTGISTRTLYELIRRGEIAVVTFGSAIRIRWEDLVDDRLQRRGQG